jgi:hypothetical protein
MWTDVVSLPKSLLNCRPPGSARNSASTGMHSLQPLQQVVYQVWQDTRLQRRLEGLVVSNNGADTGLNMQGNASMVALMAWSNWQHARERLPYYGHFVYVEMIWFLMVKFYLPCRLSTDVCIDFVRGLRYTEWSTDHCSRWCVRGWSR